MRVFEKKISNLTLLNWGLIAMTVFTALVYIVGSIKAALNHGSVPHLESNFFGSPRGGIVICWAIAATALLVLPEIGKVISGISLIGVLTFFALWYDKTLGIQRAVGSDYKSDVWFQNYFVGAVGLDIVVLLLAGALLFLDALVIFKNLKRSFRPKDDHPKPLHA